MAAYDAMCRDLRLLVAGSPWPVPIAPLVRAYGIGGLRLAQRRLRELEQRFAADHEAVTAEACER